MLMLMLMAPAILSINLPGPPYAGPRSFQPQWKDLWKVSRPSRTLYGSIVVREFREQIAYCSPGPRAFESTTTTTTTTTKSTTTPATTFLIVAAPFRTAAPPLLASRSFSWPDGSHEEDKTDFPVEGLNHSRPDALCRLQAWPDALCLPSPMAPNPQD
jgi:hypothetical protein